MLIVGLGNPGANYEFTRHNAGFLTLDSLVTSFSCSWQKNTKLCSYIATSIYKDKKLIFIKPTTYMNLSGTAVALVKNYYKIDLDDIVVIHDELDLKCGIVRYKVGGGSAGHRGIKSIDSMIGNLYHRIRIGIDKPIMEEQVSDYVLGKFTNEEKKSIDKAISIITDGFKLFLDKDIVKFKSLIEATKEL